MVITHQTLEFGRSSTVMGITTLRKLLTGKKGVDKSSLNKETHYYFIIRNERLG